MAARGQHLKRRRKIYVALEEYDFTWDEFELIDFIRMWKEGLPLKDIAEHFKRKPIECVLLVMDLAERGKIRPRIHGLFGGR